MTRCAADAMLAAARDSGPEEACGLLLGSGRHVVAARALLNVAPDRARRFEIDPAGLIAAERAAREGSGPAVIGCFHSHPAGPPVPSQTDAAAAAPDGRLWAIVGQERIGWWVAVAQGSHLGRFDPAQVVLAEDPPCKGGALAS